MKAIKKQDNRGGIRLPQVSHSIFSFGKSKYSGFEIVLSVLMLMGSIIMLMPFFLMLSTSLKTMQEVSGATFRFLPDKMMFINYYTAMTRGNWMRYMYNSFVITGIAVVVSLLFNSLAGYAFSRLQFRGRDILFFTILLGIMIPPQVTIIPLFIIMKNFPLFGGNNILGQGGAGLVNTYLGILLPYAAGSFGIFLFRQFYLNFPSSLDEAAEIDGASKIRTFLQMYIPLSKPIFATLTVFKAVSTWNDYMWPLVITNKENMRTVQLGLSMYRGEKGTEWNLLMAGTTIVVLPLVIIFIMAQKYFVASIVTTGVKG